MFEGCPNSVLPLVKVNDQAPMTNVQFVFLGHWTLGFGHSQLGFGHSRILNTLLGRYRC